MGRLDLAKDSLIFTHMIAGVFFFWNSGKGVLSEAIYRVI